MSKRKHLTHWRRESHCPCNPALLHLPSIASTFELRSVPIIVLTARRCYTGMYLLSSR